MEVVVEQRLSATACGTWNSVSGRGDSVRGKGELRQSLARCRLEVPKTGVLFCFFLNLFYGSLVDLQCRVTFCCRAK